MRITLLSEEAIRLEPDEGPMTIEALEPDQQYSPFHMLATSLAYCTFSVLYSWATHTRQTADDLAIEVQWKFSDDEPHRVSDLFMTYAWPSLPARKAEAAKRVAHMCTIHETLMTPPRVSIEPMTPARDLGTPDAAEAGAHVPAAGEHS